MGKDKVVKINWYLLTYYVLGIMIIISIFNFLWESGRHIAAGITVVLLVMVFIFYSYRWFDPTITSSDTCNTTTSAAPACGPWPPIVNMCPDYMVLWKDTSGTSYCYDVHDTYSMKIHNGAGLTQSLTINNVPGQSAYKTSDLNNYFREGTNLGVITEDPSGKYLRWEGVWDGLILSPGKLPSV